MTEKRLFPPTRHDEVFGRLAYRGSPKSLEHMDQAITDLSHLVMAGLDPAIHVACSDSIPESVDPRVEPGDDESGKGS